MTNYEFIYDTYIIFDTNDAIDTYLSCILYKCMYLALLYHIIWPLFWWLASIVCVFQPISYCKGIQKKLNFPGQLSIPSSKVAISPVPTILTNLFEANEPTYRCLNIMILKIIVQNLLHSIEHVKQESSPLLTPSIKKRNIIVPKFDRNEW